MFINLITGFQFHNGTINTNKGRAVEVAVSRFNSTTVQLILSLE